MQFLLADSMSDESRLAYLQTKLASRASLLAGEAAANESLRSFGKSGQTIHFLLIDLDLAFFFKLVAKVLHVESLVLIALLLEQRLFRLVPILF